MASYQYVYVMDKVSKTYPGGKQILKDIRLSFLPGAKIGIVGVNGAGKSTLLKLMPAFKDAHNPNHNGQTHRKGHGKAQASSVLCFSGGA